MNKILGYANTLLDNMGCAQSVSGQLSAAMVVFAIVIILWILYVLLSRGLERAITKVAQKTSSNVDDVLLHHSTLRWVWGLIVTIIAYKTIPAALVHYPWMQTAATVLLRITMILLVMMLAIELVRKLFFLISNRDKQEYIAAQLVDASSGEEAFQYKGSLKGLQQMINIIIIGVCCILVISTVIGRDPLMIFSGLGAMAAVLMLVFQDSILGVVAGIQITANDLLQQGDWIIAPKYGANGTVQEITLAAVKVQNWDQTIITVPPYKLLTEGFQNWRGMYQSKGRRIARSINIDLLTVKFATDQQIASWSQQPWWRQPQPGTRLVNLSAFRMYLEHYLTTIPTLAGNMLFMIRELQPTADGLPVEIYFFTTQLNWKQYELIQANTIDHVLAVVGEFGLRVYQHPTQFIMQKS